jgi:hypothetical protein
VRCAVAGLLVGLAVNCKPPLGIFLLPVAAMADVPTASLRARLIRFAVILAGVGIGAAAYVGYDKYKYPGDIKETHAELVKPYGPEYVNEAWRPPVALAEMAVGPSSGTLWYAPAALLGVFGAARRAAQGERRVVLAVAVAVSVVVGFICLLPFYKGDLAWGPRYLTPLFAVGWLYAPDGVAAVGRRVAAGLLVAGCVVQVLGLAVDPQRLYHAQGLPPGLGIHHPMLLWEWELSHLWTRPREISETWSAPPAPKFNPMPEPTAAPGLLMLYDTDPSQRADRRQEMVWRYQVYSGPRFWWASLPHLPPDRRPVDLAAAGWVFGGTAAVGLGLLAIGLRGLSSVGRGRGGAAGPPGVF